MPLAKYKPTICFSQFDAKFKQHTHTETDPAHTLAAGKASSAGMPHLTFSTNRRRPHKESNDAPMAMMMEQMMSMRHGDEAADDDVATHTQRIISWFSVGSVGTQILHFSLQFHTPSQAHTHTWMPEWKAASGDGVGGRLGRNVTSIDTKVQRKYLRR